MLRLCALLVTTFMAVQGNTECERGRFGKHCNQTCPRNCALVQPSNLQFCTRDTGKCSEGCKRGWHGYLCNQDCSVNCLNTTCNQQTGHCTHGCNGQNRGDFCNITGECDRGWFGDLCEHPCSRNCLERSCKGTTGACLRGCNGTYTGEFCNTTKVSNNKDDANSLAAILVPVFLIAVAAVTIVTVFVCIRWRRRQNRKRRQTNRKHGQSSTDEENLLLNLLQKNIKKTEDAFFETENYRKVKKTLETYGRVTMSGAPGGGKTDIALMLGKEYRDEGYELVYVVDVLKFSLQYYVDRGKNMCFIFHDLFKIVELPKHKPHLLGIFKELESNLEKCKHRNELKMCVIFTANTYSDKCELPQLWEEAAYFFSRSTFIDFNLMSFKYTMDDKKKIFHRHCKDADTTLDVDKICQFEQSVLGFPQICQLFPQFKQHGEQFFREPFFFLQEELLSILELQNDRSAALILMFLCQGSLNLQQVETRSENQDLEDHFTNVRHVVRITTRSDVANAVRNFPDGFFTEGDITRFAHPTIYDACACALFSINPSLVLEQCHIKFLNEHVQYDQYLDTSAAEKYRPLIHVSHVYTGIVDQRRASENEKIQSTNQPEDRNNTGVMNKEKLNQEIAKIEHVFVETENFRKVKETLEKHGHVTMSGAAGGGKTAIALMLGKHYQKEGFKVVHVVDASKFKLDDTKAPREKVCYIFHDMFRAVYISKIRPHLKSIVRKLDKRQSRKENRNKLYIIFILNTYTDSGGRIELGEEERYIFSDSSFIDLNQSCQHTPEEKKKIYDKHCKDVVSNLDVDEICGFEQNILGFPQTCKLFAVLPSFQTRQGEFFREPFRYVREEMISILDQKNDQSAALVLMFLCEGSLNLHQVELPSDNKALEELLVAMEDVVEITTRTALARAVRQFRDGFFSKGDITGFAHPTIYVACACALSEISQAFVLKHCSIKFLCEHVQTRDNTIADDRCQPIIYVRELYRVEIKKRFSELAKDHPFYDSLKRVVDN